MVPLSKFISYEGDKVMVETDVSSTLPPPNKQKRQSHFDSTWIQDFQGIGRVLEVFLK